LATLLWTLPAALAFSQQPGSTTDSRVELGRLASGGTVAFVRASGAWGIEVAGALPMAQPKPAQIQIFHGGDGIQNLAGGYQRVGRQADAVVASVTVTNDSGAVFAFVDAWRIDGASLMLSRNVVVRGVTDTNAGFLSAVRLASAPSVKFDDATYFVPGLFYGENHGGPVSVNTGRYAVREDSLSAPMTAAMFRDGNWVAVLDSSPRGDTTQAETVAPASTPIIDERLQFGALGADEVQGGGVELGFWLPGTVTQTGGGFGMRSANAAPVTRHRYHPVKTGFAQTCEVAFRFGRADTFRDMRRQTWRWAWQTLNPRAKTVDVELMRTALLDHLADRVLVYEDRAGVPFVIDSVSGKPGSFRPAYMLARRGSMAPGSTNAPGASNAPALPGRRGGLSPQALQELAGWAGTQGIDMDTSADELQMWPKIILGFCGKNVEVGQQLIVEAGREPDSGRAQRMRKLGLTIIDSIVRIIRMSPAPAAEGFDIRTGQPGGIGGGTGFSLRSLGEDTRAMIDLIRNERAHGRQHPDWSKWVKDYCDWLLTTQRENGSFPGNFQGGSGQTTGSSSGATSYGAIPTLVLMTGETGDKKYLDAAIRAGEFLWQNFSSKDLYLGAIGGEGSDKESGMLSLEAFLALYENTKDARWLDRAQAAGGYAESWIWIWNVPMPIGASYTELGWKPGASTVGANGISARDNDMVDQYLDWAVPSFARLYKYTGDEHYLDVARILLHGTKAMLALPGREYDLKSPGCQQEHWHMGPGPRGVGAHRTWLPWISVNHVHGIVGLEEFDKDLYQRLSRGN
jgi:hypothetical protein